MSDAYLRMPISGAMERCSPISFVPILLCGILGLLAPIAAQGDALTAADRQELQPLLPPGFGRTIESGDALRQSSAELLQASREADPCSIGGKLVAAGAALDEASVAITHLRPMLLPMEPVAVPGLMGSDNAADAALARNIRRQAAYKDAVSRIARAAGLLESMDPLGPTDATQAAGATLDAAGSMLQDIQEQSGIGFHISQLGDALIAFHSATLQLSASSCSQAVHNLGVVMGLVSGSLGGDIDLVWQDTATRMLGVALYADVAGGNRLSAAGLVHVLDLYRKGLLEYAESLRTRASLARSMDPPSEPAAQFFEAGAVGQERSAADISQIVDGLSRLTGSETSPTAIAGVLRSAGERMQAPGHVLPLVVAGKALASAAGLVAAGEWTKAMAALQQGGVDVNDVEDAHPLTE